MSRLPWDSFGWWFLVTALLATGVIWAIGRWIVREIARWWDWRTK